MLCASLQVEVSKLERLELSSVPIVLIWSDRSSQRSSFQNLTHLDVNGCWKLKYLLSFSMAKSLACLQSLFVSECEKMRSIFPLEQDSHQKMKVSRLVGLDWFLFLFIYIYIYLLFNMKTNITPSPKYHSCYKIFNLVGETCFDKI